MNYILFEDNIRNQLLPFTFTRTVADIRIGILTIREKWEKHLSSATSTFTQQHLQEKYPLVIEKKNILINATILPNTDILEEIKELNINEKLVANNSLVAVKLSGDMLKDAIARNIPFIKLDLPKVQSNYPLFQLNNVTDIFSKNQQAIEQDFHFITKRRVTKSIKLSKTNTTIGNNIFIEEGAKVEGAFLNASEGPIYIGKDAEVMEGSLVRGPFALCERATLKMGAKIYGATTIGPFSKVGGEVSNSVIFGYSNKAHDGFLGNSVIGEWCNIGADSNNSNLKNNYAEVKLWSYITQRFEKTGLQYCGLIMGDHSKCGINTMFNTGTVVGVSANIFGAGFPRNFIPSFSWGGAHGLSTYQLEKALEVGEKVMERRNKKLDEVERRILQHVFTITQPFRK